MGRGVKIMECKLAGGTIVSVDDKTIQKNLLYDCTKCSTKVKRYSNEEKKYFQHVKSNPDCPFEIECKTKIWPNESEQHKLAKQKIHDYIKNYSYNWKCDNCNLTIETINISNVSEREMEYTGIKGIIPDIYVLYEGSKKLAIEICYKNPVKPEKMKIYENQNIKCFEVKAEDVLNNKDKKLYSMDKRLCDNCNQTTKQIEELKKVEIEESKKEELKKEEEIEAIKPKTIIKDISICKICFIAVEKDTLWKGRCFNCLKICENCNSDENCLISKQDIDFLNYCNNCSLNRYKMRNTIFGSIKFQFQKMIYGGWKLIPENTKNLMFDKLYIDNKQRQFENLEKLNIKLNNILLEYQKQE
jgi:hypothetical protein